MIKRKCMESRSSRMSGGNDCVLERLGPNKFNGRDFDPDVTTAARDYSKLGPPDPELYACG